MQINVPLLTRASNTILKFVSWREVAPLPVLQRQLAQFLVRSSIETQVITEADVYLLVYCTVANILAMLTVALFIVRH